MELILMRHSITPGNLERRFVGTTDQPLAPEGETLAVAVSPLLPEVEYLYVSPMLRCRQTADLLWPGVERTIIPDLRETSFGPFEGMCHTELVDNQVYQRWLKGELCPGEAIEDCNDRATAALTALLTDCVACGYQRVGVVAHGGLLMGMLSRHGTPDRAYYDWLLPNCGGYRVELVAPMTLQLLGEVGRTKE